MLVEGIEKTVAKAPKKEEDRNQANGIQRLAQSQFGGSRTTAVVGSEGPPLEKFLD